VVNLALRPDDEVTLPELTLSLRWWVVSVDRAAGQAKLRTIIFETPQSFTVEIENVEWEPHMEGMEDAA